LEYDVVINLGLQGVLGKAMARLGVRQLRHHLGPFLAHFSALTHRTRAVSRVLLADHAGRVLIGAWNPML